jgi:CMP-N,N'-diacetyllegionaminic acid synthase
MNSNPRILGLIPARGGSKGIPGKNIKPLNGLPLLQYTFQSASDSKLLTKTILSSDDDEVIAVAKNIGLEVPFVRPSDLALDNSPTLPVILHAIDFLEAEGEYFDAVCLLQTTTPFRSKGFVDKAIKTFIDSGADALVSVLVVPHEYNPHWVFENNEDNLLRIATGEKEIITRRQELPPAYIRDGAIYITKTSVLKEQNSLYGNSLAYIKSDAAFHVNLDTLQDWAEAEKMVLQYNTLK